MVAELDKIKSEFGIGLTGGIASGKSTMGKILQERGYLVIDADALVAKVLLDNEVIHQVKNSFGEDLEGEDGLLNKSLLGERALARSDSALLLQSIIHPRLPAELEQELARLGWFEDPKIWFYEASLLLETGGYKDFFEVWACVCGENIQIERALKRNNKMTVDLIKKRISLQCNDNLRRRLADRVIETHLSLGSAARQLDECLRAVLLDRQGS